VTATDEPLADLISHLDEQKFRQLFRSLIDEHTERGDSLTLPTPNSYVFARYVKRGAMSSTGWFFHVAYLPYSMWQSDILHSVFEDELRTALSDLRRLRVTPFGRRRGDPPEDTNFLMYRDGWLPDGYTYHFVSNAISRYLVSAKTRQWPSKNAYRDAERLFREILDMEFGRTFAFGFGTPLTIARYKRRKIRDELIRYLNAPSSYTLIAREGRLSVVPTGVHDVLFASASRESTVGAADCGLSTTLCSHSEARVPDSVISAFEELLNSRHTKERDLQLFLEVNPHLLMGLDERYSEIRPHVCLIDRRGTTLIPDFMARIDNSDVWDVIELKLPTMNPMSPGEPLRPSVNAARGIGQLLTYRDFFARQENRRRLTSYFGTHGYEPALVLMLGSGHQRYEWNSVKNRFPTVRVVPYDYIVERARMCKACRAFNRKREIPT
jgi:hypothetical protein